MSLKIVAAIVRWFLRVVALLVVVGIPVATAHATRRASVGLPAVGLPAMGH